ncbi:VOC family protein [Brachybacterium endophyticum]|uniref:VOC family protein n=1 Tax=Brachybacterium endophyticum TaxID=2182385 RepID=A0A2U2RGS3_9MICO|nr:VOC family protein [Brachybacterium endophyticum]PWH05069.1 VOC family protein [Brachybacterium endophyticum]
MSRSIGTSTWLDVSVKDLDAAKAFYSGLFGWEFENLGDDFNGYHLIRNDGALVGGLMDVSGMTCPEGDPLPAAWGVYLLVDDAEARVRRVTDNGGTVIVPLDGISDTGRMAIVLDPTGADVGLWEPGTLEGYEFTGSPGSPVWFELMTHEFDAACAFYTAVVDADLVPMSEPMEDDSFRYVTNGPEGKNGWGIGDATGVMPKEATGWRVYLGVEEADAAVTRVQDLGGKLLEGPVDSPFGRIATVTDPDGASFQLCAMSEAVPEG